MKIELFTDDGLQLDSVHLRELDHDEAQEIMDEVRESVRKRS